MKKVVLMAFLGAFAVGAPPIKGGERIAVRVSPAVAMEPAYLTIRTSVEPSDENRKLTVTVESEEYSSSSDIPLEGRNAARLNVVEVRDVPSGLYEIVSGTYTECCGVASDFSLPNERQRFVSLAVDPQWNSATMTFIGQDAQTVFSILPCPAGSAVPFRLNFGSIVSNSITFHADPAPLPDAMFWVYWITNSTNSLQINGTFGVIQQNCVDAPTRFMHSDVVAVLVPPLKMRVTEVSESGATLFVQGHANWTTVVQASTDLVLWTGISTNVLPDAICPECSYILVRDPAATNTVHRYYRCFQTL